MIIHLDPITQDMARDDMMERLAAIDDVAEFAAVVRGTLAGAVLAALHRFEFSSVRAVVDEVMELAAEAASGDG